MTRGLLRGAIAGALATAPMSLVMVALQHALPGRRETLPPREITENLLEAAELHPRCDRASTENLTLVGHFGYGAVCGALLSPLTRGARSGVAAGVLVWGASYLGWLPAVDLFPSATEKPARQNALMIASHVVWGAALGILLRQSHRQR